MEKPCFKCGEIKPLSAFYKHPQMPDGHVNKCKECNKKDVRQNREKNIDYYRAYDKDRANLPHRVSARAAYQATDAGRASVAASKKKWMESNTIKNAAKYMVNNAVRDGRLKKEYSCSNCGITGVRIHGHHDDYSKPLDVRWLCSKCHMAWHKENGEGLNG